jgi:hypothetical protein
MRELWAILLFVGGLIAGGAAGAVYHLVKVRSYAQSAELQEQKVAELNKQLEHEQETAAADRSDA